MNYVQTSTMPEQSFIYEDQNNHTGWICPKCGKAVSPEYKVCPYCSTTQADENMAPGEQMICGWNKIYIKYGWKFWLHSR